MRNIAEGEINFVILGDKSYVGEIPYKGNAQLRNPSYIAQIIKQRTEQNP